MFLLSYRELLRYFTEQNDRKVTGTEYARSKGARFAGITTIGIGETDWWLRSPGKSTHDSAFVSVYGDIGTKGVASKLGIRPAIRLDLSADPANYPFNRFTQAASFAELEDYASAAEIFESLGEYNNSAALALSCRYCQAIQASETGDYDTAISVFEALDGYEDSNALGRAARYAKAVSCQEAGDYALAGTLYGEVGQYEDSMTRMKQCFEKQGRRRECRSGQRVLSDRRHR